MTVLTALILVAMAATVVSLMFGVAAMASDGEVNHRSSADWMVWRVLFQASALALIVVALFA